jgi:hypothetical protein
MRMSGRATAGRGVVGLVAGTAVAVAPYLYYWRLDWQQLQTTGGLHLWTLVGPVVAAGFVGTTIGHRRPRWWLGALLGLALGLVTGILFLRAAGDMPQEWWALFLLGLLMAVSGGLGGALGGLIGWTVSQALDRRAAGGMDGRVLPWHVGAAVAAIMIVLFGTLAAVG